MRGRFVDFLNDVLRRLPSRPLYALAPVWSAWLFWRALVGDSGPNPVNALERGLGRAALWTLLLTLAITPLRRLTGLSLLRFRRALGVSAFLLAAAHLLVWLLLDLRDWNLIANDLVKRPYIIVGMAALLLMIPLAATSTNGAIRRLGAARWRRLHRLIYVIAPLAAAHFVMVRKGWQPEPLFWFGVAGALLILRLKGLSWVFPARRSARVGVVPSRQGALSRRSFRHHG